MSGYKVLLILVFPLVLGLITLFWAIEYPRFTWKEMFLNCWEAS